MIRTLTLADALAVTAAMRPEDRACVRAVMGDAGDEVFAVNRWQTEGPAWTLLQEGCPVAIFGLAFSTAWIAVAWLVATPAVTLQSWRKLMRFALRVRANATSRANEHFRHRLEAHVLAGWKQASDFAARLGFVLEGTRRAAGKGGEDLEVWGIACRPDT